MIEAINDANSTSETTTILLAVDCTYQLTEVNNDTDGANGLPSIRSPITIIGFNSVISRVGAARTLNFRIFHIAPEGELTLEDVTVRGGAGVAESIFDSDDRGGGIYNGGSLIVSGSSISHNFATQGGGIYNLGTLIVTNGSEITINQAESFLGRGAGIYNYQGEITIEASSISGNTTVGKGAGVYSNGGSVEISSSNILDNTAGSFGGGILSTGTLSIVDSTISGNIAGGIFSSGNLEVRGSTINNNEGGGILNGTGCAATIEYSIISNNTGASGIHNQGALTLAFSTLSGNRGDRTGGGIYNEGELFINSSTLADNFVTNRGGGIFNINSRAWAESPTNPSVEHLEGLEPPLGGDAAPALCDQEISPGLLIINNSTLSGNSSGRGGALFNGYGGEVSIIYSTLAVNDPGEGGGGIFDESAGLGSIEFINSIVANNSRGGDCVSAPGVFTTSGNNLDSDGSCEGFTMTEDPALGALEYNGGRTATHALLEGSPAIDAASGECPTVDQRTIHRPFGGGCDIGAFESNLTVTAETDFSCGGIQGVTILENGKMRTNVLVPEASGNFEATLNNDQVTCQAYEDYPDTLLCDSPKPPGNTLATLVIFDPLGIEFCNQTFTVPGQNIPKSCKPPPGGCGFAQDGYYWSKKDCECKKCPSGQSYDEDKRTCN